MVAIDKDSNRLLFHQRIKSQHKERHFTLPLEIFLINSEVTLHHDLIDPQIAICAPSVLPLFTDNFDFESRDDFIRGLLINEEILGNSIYCVELGPEQYAAKVSNWQTYQAIRYAILFYYCPVGFLIIRLLFLLALTSLIDGFILWFQIWGFVL